MPTINIRRNNRQNTIGRNAKNANFYRLSLYILRGGKKPPKIAPSQTGKNSGKARRPTHEDEKKKGGHSGLRRTPPLEPIQQACPLFSKDAPIFSMQMVVSPFPYTRFSTER